MHRSTLSALSCACLLVLAMDAFARDPIVEACAASSRGPDGRIDQTALSRCIMERSAAQRTEQAAEAARQREEAAKRRDEERSARERAEQERREEEERAARVAADAKAATEAAAAAAAAEDRAADAALRQNPAQLRVIASLNICSARQSEQKALAEIKQENANSRIAGVRDLRRLKELQDAVVRERARQARATKLLKGAQPWPCGHKAMGEVLRCAVAEDEAAERPVVIGRDGKVVESGETDAACATPAMRATLRALNQLAGGELTWL